MTTASEVKSAKLNAVAWLVLSSGLVTGLGSGVYSVSQSQEIGEKVADRFTGTQHAGYARVVEGEFALRDAEIRYLAREIQRIGTEITVLRGNIPPPAVSKALSDYEHRLRELEGDDHDK